jgi:hypothetical protein
MVEKKQEAEILDDGILVHITPDYWVKFVKSWGTQDATKFFNASDTDSLRFMIGKIVDWCIPDSDWNPIKFDKEKLLAQLDAYKAYQDKIARLREEKKYTEISKEPIPECFAFPTALHLPLSSALSEAISKSYAIPFDQLCQFSRPVAKT